MRKDKESGYLLKKMLELQYMRRQISKFYMAMHRNENAECRGLPLQTGFSFFIRKRKF